MFGERFPEHINNIKKDKKLEPAFEPSTKILARILNNLTAKGAKTKSALAVDTKVNYTRLVKHIVWMENKGLVEKKINKSRIEVELTKKGKEFASALPKG